MLIVTALGVAITVGLPPPQAILFVALNAAFVGFSEELMFRGFLLRGASETGRFWFTFILRTVLFGAVHLANIFITGEVLTVTIQAVSASCSGVLLLAIRLRTGSLYPMILVHWMWDFAVTIVSLALAANAVAAAGVIPQVVGGLLLLAPIISLILGLYLLRKGRASCPEWSGEISKPSSLASGSTSL